MKPTSRRTFIQQTAFAGTAVLVARPTRLFSQDHRKGNTTSNINSKGYAGKDKSGKLQLWNFERRPVGGNDILIDINQLKIRIGSKTFSATLANNATVTAFMARLPMTVSMSELNGNEKLYNLPVSLPSNSSNPKNIETGDLLIYGSSTLVLFYQSFSTRYSYTKLGKIDDTAGLAAAVGTGSATVTFELEK